MGVEPPLVGVAEKVTEVPVQTGFPDGEIKTLTGRLALTLIVIEFDVAGLPVAQVALEVKIQMFASLFDGT